MISKQHTKDYDNFSEHPLSSLFFEYVNILKQHHFLKEAEDLLATDATEPVFVHHDYEKQT
jgi:hypothetical protein